MVTLFLPLTSFVRRVRVLKRPRASSSRKKTLKRSDNNGSKQVIHYNAAFINSRLLYTIVIPSLVGLRYFVADTLSLGCLTPEMRSYVIELGVKAGFIVCMFFASSDMHTPQIVQEKQKFRKAPTNYAMTKSRLLREKVHLLWNMYIYMCYMPIFNCMVFHALYTMQ